MIGWWWMPEEHKMFAQWADREAPGWVKTIFLHISYDKTRVGDVVLPSGCARGAFVHIGYPERNVSGDRYGMLGPLAAPKRLRKTLDDLHDQGIARLMDYSEGKCDDVNVALFAGLSSGKYGSSDEVLRAYAKRYFGADDATSKDWAKWLADWGDLFAVDIGQSRRKLDELLAKTPKKNDWRLRQWELKLELFRLHSEIAKGKQWTPERLELVDRFCAVREKIQRGLWGLGPQRHWFHRNYCGLSWYGSWAKHVSEEAKEGIDKEQ